MKQELAFHRANPEFALCVLALCCLLFSCEGSKLTPQVLVGDAVNVAAGAGIGYLEGGQTGAAMGAAAAELRNLKRLTGAKNPPARSITP